MTKEECLEILDEIEIARRQVEAKPERMNKDFIFRYIENLLARKAGFENRAEWTNALLNDHSSEFAKYHHFFPNVEIENGVAYTGYYIGMNCEGTEKH